MFEETDREIQLFINEGREVPILNYGKPQRTVLRGVTFNKGLDLRRAGSVLTPIDDFFQRSHLSSAPVGQVQVPLDEWAVSFEGLFEKPGSMSLDEMRDRYETVRRVVHMECTGNSHATNTRAQNVKSMARHFTWRKALRALDPAHWKPLLTFVRGGRKSDLVSNALFEGVRLWDIIRDHPLEVGAKELVFFGADRGYDGLHHRVTQEEHPYARAFSVSELSLYEPLLCWKMNGEWLLPVHGAPVRLVVPGVYGAEYVKWLHKVVAVAERWTGHFQKEYYANKTADGGWEPCHAKGPKSLALHVRRYRSGGLAVIGVAWSGLDRPTHVQVILEPEGGSGRVTTSARWLSEPVDQSWRWWRAYFEAVPSGRVTIRPCAWDASGAWQPDEQPPERFYGNNAVVPAEVKL